MNPHPLYSWKKQPERKIVIKFFICIVYSSICYIVLIYVGLYCYIFRLYIRLYIIYVYGRLRKIEEQRTNTRILQLLGKSFIQYSNEPYWKSEIPQIVNSTYILDIQKVFEFFLSKIRNSLFHAIEGKKKNKDFFDHFFCEAGMPPSCLTTPGSYSCP